MKLLVNPEFLGLVKILKQKEQAQILLAILSYPNDECRHPIWILMRKQIERDAKKYQKKCETLSENRQNRWPNDNRNATDGEQTGGVAATKNAQADAISTGIEKPSIESEKQNCIETKRAVDKLVNIAARNMDANAPARYLVSEDFDFDSIAERDAKFRETFCNGHYTETHLQKAQNSLYNKRYGQKLTLAQIEAWVKQEGQF
jgi:hypothetical protein